MLSSLKTRAEKTDTAFDINGQKKELRRVFKEKRRALTEAERESFSRALCENITSLKAFVGAEEVLSFWPISDETDVRGLNKAALSLGKTLYLPRCIKGTREMEFYGIRSEDDLEKGSFSIMEPKEGCPVFRPTDGKRAVCIVPALAFDINGYRLGYGGGFYDRYLSRFDLYTVGAVYSPFLTEEALPRDGYDVSVDVIVTDKEIRIL